MTENNFQQDENTRQQFRENLNASFTIEAGAGTGKTTLLVDRITALVQRFSILKIAAITFTEKAARELADRVRTKLEREVLSGSDTEPPPRRLIEALDAIDAAALSTIHSFAASLVREQAIAAGFDPEFEHITPTEETELVREQFARFLQNSSEEFISLMGVFQALGGNNNDLLTLVDILYDKRDFPKAKTDIFDPSVWQIEYQKLVDFALQLAEIAKKHADASDGGYIQITSATDDIPKNFDPYSVQCLEWLDTIGRLKYTIGTQKNWKPKEVLKDFKVQVKELREQKSIFLNFIRSTILEQLCQHFEPLIESIETQKLNNSVISFQDLLIRARHVLDTPEIMQHFLDHYERVLIDEFQDTDPLQMEIALRLAAPVATDVDVYKQALEPGRLCIVGDPKQSIYRFRGADPKIYGIAVERLNTIGNFGVISRNFRSAPGVLNFVNAFFTMAWQNLSDQSIPYIPIHADSARENPTPSPSVLVITPDTDTAETALRADDLRMLEAQAIADTLSRAVRDEHWTIFDKEKKVFRPIKWTDCALLLPTTTGIDIFTDVLFSNGIPYQVEGGKYFFKRLIVQELANYVLAIDNPSDSLNVIACLRSRMFGISDKALYDWKKTDPTLDYRKTPGDISNELKTALALLNDLHLCRNDLPVNLLLKKALESSAGMAMILTQPNPDNDISAINRILDLAVRWTEENGNCFRSFKRWLVSTVENRDDEGETQPVRERGVSLITIHSAKGLEFPLVVLANIGGKRKAFQINDIADRVHKKLHISIGAGSRGIFSTQGYDEFKEKELAADQAEKLRLLYVAMTRARDHLIIPLFFKPNKDGETDVFYPMLLNEFLNSSDQTDTDAPFYRTEVFKPSPNPANHKTTATGNVNIDHYWQELEAWRVDRDERLKSSVAALPSYHSPSSHVQPFNPEEAPAPASPKLSDDDPTAIGRAYHLYLSLCKLEEKIDNLLLGKMCHAEGVAVESVRQVLMNTLSSDLWREIIHARRVMRETPISSLDGNIVTNGAIDVVWENEQGELSLADYKSGVPQPEQHKAQIQEYARLLKASTGRKVKRAVLYYADSETVVNGLDET